MIRIHGTLGQIQNLNFWDSLASLFSVSWESFRAEIFVFLDVHTGMSFLLGPPCTFD